MALTLYCFSKLLQLLLARLYRMRKKKMMKAQKKNDTVEFVLIGVHPKYQKKGITSIIFKDMFETFTKHNIKYLETNPELEDNQSVQALWTNYNPVLHKRRKTFKKAIS